MISSLLQEIPNALVYNNRKILQEERMKNVSERLLKTLAFENVENEGAVAEATPSVSVLPVFSGRRENLWGWKNIWPHFMRCRN